MWYNGSMVVDVNVLTSGWTIAGVIASFLVAAVALGLGVFSFIQTKNLQKKERRDRLLSEIIEWVTDIEKASLEVDLPVTVASLTEKQLKRIEVNTFLRYRIPFSKNDYIYEVVKNLFPELKSTFVELRDTFVGFMFLQCKDFGIEDPEDPFKDTKYSETIENIKQELNKRGNNVGQLLYEYSNNLEYYTNELLKKSADSKCKLV